MTEFHIPGRALKPNPYFLDINKKDLSKKILVARKHTNIFSVYEGHLSSINKVFADCPVEHQFWLHSGKSLKNLRELYEELKVMSDESYRKHVSKDKNDFANWVKFVFKDERLAMSLDYASTRAEALSAVEKRAEEMVAEGITDDRVFEDEVKRLKSKNTKLEEEIRQKKEWLMGRHKELETREKAAIEKEKQLQERYRQLEKQEREIKAQMLVQDQRVKQAREEEHKIERQERKEESLEHIYRELDTLIESARLHITDGNLFMAKQLIPQIRVLYTQIDKDNPRKREFWLKLSQLKQHGESALANK